MSLIFSEDNRVKLGGVLLPGVVQKLEVTANAAIDQVEVEGSARSPKQAVGYEESAIKIDLLIGDTESASTEDKLATLYSLFRRKGQAIPQPLDIVCAETARAGVDRVLFQKLNRVTDKKTDLVTVSLEFCEYIPVTVTATKSAGAAAPTPKATGTTPRPYGPTAPTGAAPQPPLAEWQINRPLPTIGKDGVNAQPMKPPRPMPTIGKDGMTVQPLPPADPALLEKLLAANNKYGG